MWFPHVGECDGDYWASGEAGNDPPGRNPTVHEPHAAVSVSATTAVFIPPPPNSPLRKRSISRLNTENRECRARKAWYL